MASRVTPMDLVRLEQEMIGYLGFVELVTSGDRWAFITRNRGDLLGLGYLSKRELFNAARAFIQGYKLAKIA